MKYLVCIKHVPDTETKVTPHADGTRLDPAVVSKWGASPFDEYALEQALRFREAAGEGEGGPVRRLLKGSFIMILFNFDYVFNI